MFNNAHHVLEWAYNTSARPIVKLSSIYHMRRSLYKSMPNLLLLDLTTHDRHGQAALIIGMVEKLHSPEAREYIGAWFGRKLSQDDMKVLVYLGCDVSGLGLSGQETVYRIIRGYFSGNVTYRAIQKMLRCSNGHALEVKTCLYDALDHIYDRAMADISVVFDAHGLIQPRRMATLAH